MNRSLSFATATQVVMIHTRSTIILRPHRWTSYCSRVKLGAKFSLPKLIEAKIRILCLSVSIQTSTQVMQSRLVAQSFRRAFRTRKNWLCYIFPSNQRKMSTISTCSDCPWGTSTTSSLGKLTASFLRRRKVKDASNSKSAAYPPAEPSF